MKLKNHTKDKFKVDTEPIPKKCEQYPAFSFRYLTTNSTYNLNYFKSTQESEKNKMLAELSKRITEITSDTWLKWGSKGKKIGYETLIYSNLAFSSNKLPDTFTKDEKVYIFRLNGSSYRFIGVKIDYCPTLYIIGFDFNFSAYKHE